MDIADGGNSFTATGRSHLPVLTGMPAEDETSLYGCTVYPNMFIDVTGTGAISTALLPRDAGHTTVITEYLFQPRGDCLRRLRPDRGRRLRGAGRRPGLRGLRRVQRGVRSRAFTHGVLAEKDGLLDSFYARYLAERGVD